MNRTTVMPAERRTVSRRSVALGAAWAVPAVAFAGAAPAFAASRILVTNAGSSQTCTGPGSDYYSSGYGGSTSPYQAITTKKDTASVQEIWWSMGWTAQTALPSGTQLVWTMTITQPDTRLANMNQSYLTSPGPWYSRTGLNGSGNTNNVGYTSTSTSKTFTAVKVLNGPQVAGNTQCWYWYSGSNGIQIKSSDTAGWLVTVSGPAVYDAAGTLLQSAAQTCTYTIKDQSATWAYSSPSCT